jgi:hypothetical protein
VVGSGGPGEDDCAYDCGRDRNEISRPWHVPASPYCAGQLPCRRWLQQHDSTAGRSGQGTTVSRAEPPSRDERPPSVQQRPRRLPRGPGRAD